MSKQTAVEWLYNLSKERELDIFDLQQAKVQHKQEIIDAYRVGATEVHMIGLHKPEVYYTETYSPSLHGGEMTMNNNNPGTTTTINTQELETLMIMYLDGIEFYGTDSEWVEARTVLESFMRYINTLDK